jgi:histidinol phosphatase-like enzyme (inositol monophosphatase family)
MPASRCPIEFWAFAGQLADASGAVIRRYFRHPFAVDRKADASPVTAADRDSETAIRALIEKHFPAHGIVGEEFGSVRAGADHVWVIDPIDGTRAFVAGKPLFATLIALVANGVPILGVIDQPVSGERWLGAAGRPTTLNGEPVHTRKCTKLGDALLSATSPEIFRDADARAFDRLKSRVRQNHWGGDAYAYGLVASGFIDLVVEAGLRFHDFAALVPVIEGAGGMVRDWRGGPLSAASDGRVVALGDPGLLPEATAVLTG